MNYGNGLSEISNDDGEVCLVDPERVKNGLQISEPIYVNLSSWQ